MSRRNKRNNPYKTPPTEPQGRGQERNLSVHQSRPAAPVDRHHADLDLQPSRWRGRGAPCDSDASDGTRQAGFGSWGNRVGGVGCSRLLFPDRVKQLIDERTRAYAVQLYPRSLLEWQVVRLSDRCGDVQSDRQRDQLTAVTWRSRRPESTHHAGQKTGQAERRRSLPKASARNLPGSPRSWAGASTALSTSSIDPTG